VEQVAGRPCSGRRRRRRYGKGGRVAVEQNRSRGRVVTLGSSGRAGWPEPLHPILCTGGPPSFACQGVTPCAALSPENIASPPGYAVVFHAYRERRRCPPVHAGRVRRDHGTPRCSRLRGYRYSGHTRLSAAVVSDSRRMRIRYRSGPRAVRPICRIVEGGRCGGVG